LLAAFFFFFAAMSFTPWFSCDAKTLRAFGPMRERPLRSENHFFCDRPPVALAHVAHVMAPA
jgi:hypothetical protein